MKDINLGFIILKRMNVEGLGIQKSISLLETFFAEFMGRGHIVTMDSEYMGKLAAQVGREVWKLNMVGTSQCNRIGAGNEVKAHRTKMKVGTYKCCFFSTQNSTTCCYSLG